MPSIDRDRNIIRHMLKYCDEVETAHDDFSHSKERFMNSSTYRNAVTMPILQIGELSGSLSEEYRQENADRIQWWSIKAMRNLVAHSYCRLDQSMMIWITATVDIPALLQFCEDELSLG